MFFINANAKRHNQKLERYARRRVAWFLGLTFILSNVVSPIFVMAAPQVFSRPGAGVSRMPLGVGGVAAPGFGELAQATNIANGNVYVDMGSVARNNQITSGDEGANSIGGGQWQLKERLRLNGFSKNWGNELSANRITNQDISSSYWDGYIAKPPVLPVNRFASSDGGCGGNFSGLLRETPGAVLPLGRYRISADVRADANMYFWMGPNDYNSQGFTATPTWQTFSFEVDLTTNPQQQYGRFFEIGEGAPNNPAWEVANLVMQRLENGNWTSNLIQEQNGNNAYWGGYCTKPAIETFSRLLSADVGGNVAWNGHSGLVRYETLAVGKYRVSVQARTRSGTLPIVYGINDYYTTSATLNTNWQTLTFDTTIANQPQQRVFEIIETTLNNQSWEIKDISVKQIFEPAPTITLSSGDGSTAIFNKVSVPNTAWFGDKPSWINRYKGPTDAQPVLADTHIYSLAPKGGTQYSAEYIVLRSRAGNNSIAHYYTADGTRVTFFNDGEFADYTQTLHQQYRGAKYNNDPEGELPWTFTPDTTTATGTPKTELTYGSVTPAGSSQPITGLLARVQDEWGRLNKYFWNGDGTLGGIQQLVQKDSDLTSWSMATNYQYTTIGNQRLINQIQQGTLDGKGGQIWRTTKFDYTWAGNSIVVSKVSKGILNGSNWRETRYEYDSVGRVSKVRTTNVAGDSLEPDTIYTYNGGGNSVVPGTNEVIVTQGTDANTQKIAKYYYDPSTGALRQKRIRDFNPWAATGYWGGHPTKTANNELVWNYEYHANGSTSKIIKPSGASEVYSYDTRGNLTNIDTYIAGGTRERSRIMTYDLDNRQNWDYMLGESGTRDGATYSYESLNNAKFYSEHSYAHPSGQNFKALSNINNEMWIVNDWRNRVKSDIDEQGRVTKKTRSATGQPDQVTDYEYFGNDTYGPWQPNWTQRAAVKQYSDLVVVETKQGLGATVYRYDEFGNITIKNNVGMLNSEVNNSNELVTTVPTNRKDHVLMQGYNGFGQKVFERIYEYGRQSNYKEWNYYGTGELDASFERDSANVTDYRYQLTGSDAGRVIGVVKGNGANWGVPDSGVRETTILTYDAFGRVASTKIDNVNTTTVTYDTLDRPVLVMKQDNNYDMTLYSPSGTPDFECNAGGPSRLDTAQCHYKTVDSLGRLMIDHVATNASGHLSGASAPNYSLQYTYDPFDRPIKIKDGRLTMNADDDSRAAFMVYDSLGNLIKQLGPVMRGEAVLGSYADNRRPYTEWEYDGFNRKKVERVLLRSGSPVPTSNIAMPADATWKPTTWNYDIWDRVAWITDADNYNTAFDYDGLGNVIEKRQQVCFDTTGECAQNFSDEDGTVNGYATTQYAYNANGQVTWTKDARGNVSRVIYNVSTQKPSQIIDARNIATKVIQYESSGLPVAEYEPDTNATSRDPNTLVGYALTKQYFYNSARALPTSVCTPHMDSINGACINLEYDWAGRNTKQTLSGGATIEQDYDYKGNVLNLKDADGFRTEYTYDAYNRLVKEFKPKRVGNATDDAAFPGIAGLENTYAYDPAGNLLRKIEKGLITQYGYNSMGKVQGETRPRKAGAELFHKWHAYRLDGEKVLESNYGYEDNSGKGRFTEVEQHGRPDYVYPNVTNGNLQQYFLSASGKRTTIVVHGGSPWEKTQYQSFNGLGLMYKRDHIGNGGIYAKFVRDNGTSNGLPHYVQFWKFDGNGNLLKSYKRSLNGSGVQDVAVDTDVFEYTYSKTNKESYRSGNTSIWAQPQINGSGDLGAPIKIGQTSGKSISAATSPPVARPQVVQETTYNNRDVVLQVTTSDTDLRGNPVARSTTYSYYKSGQVYQKTVGSHTQTFNYDDRGREISNTDSNGSQYGIRSGSVTTTTSYSSNGTITQNTTGALIYHNTRVMSLGGVVARETSSVGVAGTVYQTVPSPDPANSGKGYAGCTTEFCQTSTEYQYDSGAMQTAVVSNSEGIGIFETQTGETSTYRWGYTQPRTASYTNIYYDNYGNEASNTQCQRNLVSPVSGESFVVSNIATSIFPEGCLGVAVKTQTFSTNNALSTKTVYQLGNGGGSQGEFYYLSTYYVRYEHAYTLSSTGLRLSASVSPVEYQQGASSSTYFNDVFNNNITRYNAEDKATDLVSSAARPLYFQNSNGAQLEGYERSHFGTRYDPKGEQALSANAIIGHQPDLGAGYTRIRTKTSATVFLEGQPQFIHNLSSESGSYYKICTIDISWNCTAQSRYWELISPNTQSFRTQDETFGLADGLADDTTGKFDVMVAPAQAPSQPSSNTAPLQAPTTPLSTQTGITSASSVTSPSSSNPAPSNPATTVTTPTTGVSSPTNPATSPSNPNKPTTPATNPSTPNKPATNPSTPSNQPQTTGVSSPATGVTTQTPSNQTPASNPVSNNQPSSNPVSSPATGTTTTPLQAPSQAAPTGVTTTASSVTSPNSAPNVPTTTASSVTSPNASSNTPPVGSNASSVSSPSSSNAPSSSASSVTPPVSSVKPVGTSTVKPFDLTAAEVLEEALEAARTLLGEAFRQHLEKAIATGDEGKVRDVRNDFALTGYGIKHGLDVGVINDLNKDLQNLTQEQRDITYANIFDCLGKANSQRAKNDCLRDARQEVRNSMRMTPAERNQAFSTHCYQKMNFTCVYNREMYKDFEARGNKWVGAWAASKYNTQKPFNLMEWLASKMKGSDADWLLIAGASGALGVLALTTLLAGMAPGLAAILGPIFFTLLKDAAFAAILVRGGVSALIGVTAQVIMNGLKMKCGAKIGLFDNLGFTAVSGFGLGMLGTPNPNTVAQINGMLNGTGINALKAVLSGISSTVKELGWKNIRIQVGLGVVDDFPPCN